MPQPLVQLFAHEEPTSPLDDLLFSCLDCVFALLKASTGLGDLAGRFCGIPTCGDEWLAHFSKDDIIIIRINRFYN